MNAPLNYLPVYIGLFAIEMLAIICNCFLDISYGIFTTEVFLWFLAIAYSLRVAQRQAGVAKSNGNKIKNRFSILSLFLFPFIFIPMWGFPRAGVYLLGLLLVAYNCTITTSKQLHLAVLISLVLVIFASSHYRADWSMLFYLIPYVIALVFTLVAEQINRKVEDTYLNSLNKQLIGAQAYAIAAACLIILFIGLFLYLITPQVIWTSFSSQWGSPASSSMQGNSGNANDRGGSGSGDGELSQGNANDIRVSSNSLPTSAEIRKMARRPGMPEWQSETMMAMANALDGYEEHLKPIVIYFADLWEVFKEWLKKNLETIIFLLVALMLLMIMFGLSRLFKEAKVTLWVLSRWDYLRLGILVMHAPDEQAVIQYYKATERLFYLHDMERSKFNNAQEYLRNIPTLRKDIKTLLLELTTLFEDSRYGLQGASTDKIKRMRTLYCRIYQCIEI